jgi:hypothetical protein
MAWGKRLHKITIMAMSRKTFLHQKENMIDNKQRRLRKREPMKSAEIAQMTEIGSRLK